MARTNSKGPKWQMIDEEVCDAPFGGSAAIDLKTPCGPQSQASSASFERELEIVPEERERIKGGVVNLERLGQR
jgi:hypothetical protein